MHFQITKRSRNVALPGESAASVEEFGWRLVSQAGTLCVSAHAFASAGQARGDIADFKRAASSARFAKVLDPPSDGSTPLTPEESERADAILERRNA